MFDYQVVWIINSDDEEELGDDENDEDNEFEEEMECSDSEQFMVMILLICLSFLNMEIFFFLVWMNLILF